MRANLFHGRRFATPFLALLVLSVLVPTLAFARFGDSDRSFGVNGSSVFDFGPGDDAGEAIALAPDGRIYAAGRSATGGAGDDLAVVRVLPNGAPDPSWNGNGRVVRAIGPGTSNDTAGAAVVQPDGRLLVAGNMESGGPTGQDTFVARFNEDGTLDTSFGADGIVITSNVGGSADVSTDIAVRSDGRIVVGMWSRTTLTDYAYVVVRYLPSGSLDPDFDGDGRLVTGITPVDGSDYGQDLLVDSDGGITVAGRAGVDGTHAVSVERYRANGSLDTTWASGGRFQTAIGPDAVPAVALLRQSDGRLVVAGSSTASGFGLVRLLADGTLDPSFGTGGEVLHSLPPGTGSPLNFLAFQDAEQRLIIAGYSQTGVSSYDFGLVRRNVNGSLDSTFGDGSARTIAATTLNDGGDGNNNFGAFQSDGKYVLTAYTRVGGSNKALVIARITDYRSGDTDVPAPEPTPIPVPTPPKPGHDSPSPEVPNDPDGTGNAIDLVLRCSARPLVLTDVYERQGRVRISGVAKAPLRGKTVAIRFAATRKVVARAVIGSDGRFSATTKLPSAKLRVSNRARYQAEVGRAHSLSLKLRRRMYLTNTQRSGKKLVLRGQVITPLAKRVAPVVLSRRVDCSHWKVVGRAKPDRHGRFTVRIAQPAGVAAVFRATTTVRATTHSTKPLPTYTLPYATDFAGSK